MRRLTVVAALLVLAAPLEAQNSGYGILGIGFPTRLTSIRTRSMGDGPAATDFQSGVNPGALGQATALTIAVGASQEYRNLTIRGVETGGLHQARFPYAIMTGRLGVTQVRYSIGFFEYAERSFELSSTDTVTLRGVPVVVNDRNASAGGMIDGRAALALRLNDRWSIGTGFHVLGGSARLTANRTFSDSSYRAYVSTSDAEFQAYGWSVGVLATPSTQFRLGFSARIDTKLRRSVGDVRGPDVPLPVTLTAGADVNLGRSARLSATGAYRTWSGAGSGLPAGTTSFNTFEAGAGLELGRVTRRWFPLRLGARYATLPFSPTADQPTELNLSAGTRIRFAQDRVQFNFAGERITRSGGDASEQVWHLIVGLELIP